MEDDIRYIRYIIPVSAKISWAELYDSGKCDLIWTKINGLTAEVKVNPSGIMHTFDSPDIKILSLI